MADGYSMNIASWIRKASLSFILFTASVSGAQSELRLETDLMVHPDQMAQLLELTSSQIQNSSTWEWSQLNFSQPYKTYWSSVSAKGPFSLKFDSSQIENQVIDFELDWENPSLDVGRFEIHDVIVRRVSGINLTIYLDGACRDMSVQIPSAGWKVKGSLKWEVTPQGIQASWLNFQFSMNSSAVSSVNMGQCEGPQAIQQELRSTIESMTRDQAWMQDVLKTGILDWIGGSLKSLQSELLQTRSVKLKEDLILSWIPDGIEGLGHGMLRLPGKFAVVKEGGEKNSQVIERSYEVSSLSGVKESGFILPVDAVQQVLQFAYRNGELIYRINSSDVDSFSSLMQSRLLQFFIWPDLMSFSKKTQFYFDISSRKAPRLSNGIMAQDGVVQYDIQAPLLVNQWAPFGGQYVPYVDFVSPLRGTLSAQIAEGKFVLNIQPQSLKVSSLFRSEFSILRRVNTWIATSLLGSSVADYLRGQFFKFDIPEWTITDGVSLTVRDLQLEEKSFRIPLQFKNSK